MTRTLEEQQQSVAPRKEVQLVKHCADIMTRDPAACAPGDTVDKVARLMQRINVGPVPVVDAKQNRKLVGIVTDRDLALKIVAEGRDARKTKVEEVMTRRVVTCRGDDDVQKALDAMSQHQIRRVPIVDHDERLVGMIAQADVAISPMEPERVASVVKEISRR
jgi:CBS domain-containing protein